MSYEVVITPDFAKEAKVIAKKHPGIKSDISTLISELEANPMAGTNLGKNFYKIRMAVSGSGKGKSGGARVITYLLLEDQRVLLVEIYLKSDYDNTDVDILLGRLKDDGLI
jgi:mRNA-degrading endonuclease RelE of RelBE toxin-antitoxin system